MEQHTSLHDEAPQGASFDYSFVDTVGRIALYDDLRSAPRVVEIKPADTAAYIEALASTVYEQSHGAGGTIPYTVIREVSENFIHARFKEVVVSILDKGNTIRFADHGPGIPSKEKAQMPGFSSAVEPMKNYIRGVGSGLPIVREYLESSHGTITIEDNLGTGAVVTVSLVREEDDPLDDWDETDVLSSKREYTSGSSYASETAVVHQPYAAPLAAGTEPYPSNPAGIYPSMGSSSAPGAPTHPPTRRKATAQYPRLQLPYRLPLTEPLTRDIRATGPMEPPQPPIRPTEQRQHRRRIRVTRVPSCRRPPSPNASEYS